MTAMSTIVLNNKSNQIPQGADNPEKSPKKRGNYKLRDASVKKREEMETRKNQPRKRGPKPRPKSAPMSKYRRKTANLRERLRMGEINVAFEKLRDKLPNPMQQAGKSKCEKLTKINILHVAINYIRAMENLLETGDSGIQSFSEMTKNPLRDESEKKVEMQRVLATLMQRADKVHHQARSSKKRGKSGFRKNPETEVESSEEETEEDEMDEMDDMDEMDEMDKEQIIQYIPPASDTSWTSTDSGIHCDPLLSTLQQQQQISSGTAGSSKVPAVNLNNNNEDIMKDFTDFVDLVDSLQGMPEIDFEDNFEMFP